MSDAPEAGDEKPRRYRLRLQEYARRQLEEEAVRMIELAGEALGLEWLTALKTSMASLTTMPERCPLAPEAKRFTGPWRSAHQLLFQRTPTGPTWRIVFVIEEPAEEAPTVKVLMVRHGARRPLTRKEARQALEDL